MFCRKCGTKLKREYLFCPICGEATRIRLRGKYGMEQEELAEAVRQLKAGNEEGFSIIYFNTYKYVYNRAKYMLKNEHDVQDLVQDVYIALYKGIGELKDEKALYGWLKTVLFRQGLRFIEKNKKVDVVTEDTEFLFDVMPDENVYIEKAYGKGEDVRTVKKCIDKLSEEQRLVILAYYYDNMSVKEISNALEISEGTVKSRLYLARKHLMGLLEKEEEKQGYKFFSAGLPLIMPVIDKTLKSNVKTTKKKILAEYKDVCQQIEIKESAAMLKSTAIRESFTARVTELGLKKILLSVIGFALVGGGCGVLLVSGNQMLSVQNNMSEPSKMVKEVNVAEVSNDPGSKDLKVNSQATVNITEQKTEMKETVPEDMEVESVNREQETVTIENSNTEMAAPEPGQIEDTDEPGSAAASEPAQANNTITSQPVNTTENNKPDKSPSDLKSVGGLSYSTAVDSEDVQLSWNPVDGADGYEVYVATSEHPTYKQDSTVSGTKCTVLAGGTYHHIKVRPYRNEDGKKVYGPFCSEISTEPDIVFPESMDITSIEQEGKMVVVNVKSFTVDYYSEILLYRADSYNGDYEIAGTITCNSGTAATISRIYDDMACENDQTYYYKIRIKAFKTWPGKSDEYSNYSKVVSYQYKLN